MCVCVCVYVCVTSYVCLYGYGNPEVRIVLKVSKYVSLGPVMHCEIGAHRTQGKAVKDGTYVRTFRQLGIPTTTVLITCKIFSNPALSHDGQICWQMPPLP